MVTPTFITEEDYNVVCSSRELEILQQSDSLTRMRAESAALEEVASYLRTRYNVDAIYATTGDERNSYLVLVCVNISLYYLSQWLPQKMASSARESMYENAITWLKSVQQGKTSPNLPTHEESGSSSFPSISGGMTPSSYDW